jgi:hypothetical protein
MPSKFTNVMFIVAIITLYLLTSCIPAATPTPAPLPPSDGLSWAIRFQAQPDGYTVTKLIGTDDGDFITTPWDPDITERLNCTEHGNVSYDTDRYGDFVEFEPGGYIECDDVDLNRYVPTPLGDYIDYETCQFGSSGNVEICMQTSPLRLHAMVQLPDAVNGTYPIFFYPQSFTDSSQAVQLSTTVSARTDEQSIDFVISYLDPAANVVTLTEQVGWPTLWEPGEIPWIEREPNVLDFIEYRLDGSGHDPIQIPIEAQPSVFEFSTQPVTFYFGNYGDNMAPSRIRLYDLFLDPSDSCGSCGY